MPQRLHVFADESGNFDFSRKKDATRYFIRRMTYKTACWDASSDSCLQVADYCGWAIQRKWEAGDTGPHSQIAPKIRSEYDLFARGTTLYY